MTVEATPAGGTAWMLAGLALLLALLSLARWDARQAGVKVFDQLAAKGYRLGLGSSALLVCAGLALSAETWLERGVWSGFGLIVFVISLLR